jgi:hypothetical protein
MKIAIQFSAREEQKALPILLRHSPGMILQGGIYVVSAEAAQALRRAGVKFTETGGTAKLATAGSRKAQPRSGDSQ